MMDIHLRKAQGRDIVRAVAAGIFAFIAALAGIAALAPLSASAAKTTSTKATSTKPVIIRPSRPTYPTNPGSGNSNGQDNLTSILGPILQGLSGSINPLIGGFINGAGNSLLGNLPNLLNKLMGGLGGGGNGGAGGNGGQNVQDLLGKFYGIASSRLGGSEQSINALLATVSPDTYQKFKQEIAANPMGVASILQQGGGDPATALKNYLASKYGETFTSKPSAMPNPNDNNPAPVVPETPTTPDAPVTPPDAAAAQAKYSIGDVSGITMEKISPLMSQVDSQTIAILTKGVVMTDLLSDDPAKKQAAFLALTKNLNANLDKIPPNVLQVLQDNGIIVKNPEPAATVYPMAESPVVAAPVAIAAPSETAASGTNTFEMPDVTGAFKNVWDNLPSFPSFSDYFGSNAPKVIRSENGINTVVDSAGLQSVVITDSSKVIPNATYNSTLGLIQTTGENGKPVFLTETGDPATINADGTIETKDGGSYDPLHKGVYKNEYGEMIDLKTGEPTTPALVSDLGANADFAQILQNLDVTANSQPLVDSITQPEYTPTPTETVPTGVATTNTQSPENTGNGEIYWNDYYDFGNYPQEGSVATIGEYPQQFNGLPFWNVTYPNPSNSPYNPVQYEQPMNIVNNSTPPVDWNSYYNYEPLYPTCDPASGTC